jgi:hypothetical protein
VGATASAAGCGANVSNDAINAKTIARFLKGEEVTVLMLITLQVSG